MSDMDPISTINGKLNLNAGIRLGGEEIKCWAPDNHGSGVFKIVLSAEDCVALGKAFTDLGKKMSKTISSNKKLAKDGKTAYDRKLEQVYSQAKEIVKERKSKRSAKNELDDKLVGKGKQVTKERKAKPAAKKVASKTAEASPE